MKYFFGLLGVLDPDEIVTLIFYYKQLDLKHKLPLIPDSQDPD